MSVTAESERINAFHKQRTMFAVIDGAMIFCRPNDVRDHKTWFDHAGWSKHFDSATRGFVDSSGIYAYVGENYLDHWWIEGDLVANADLLAAHAASESVAWAGMKPGDPGTRWEPVRRVGTLAELLERSKVVMTPIRLRTSTAELLKKALGNDQAVGELVRRAVGPDAEDRVLALLRRECHPHDFKKTGSGGDPNELFECQRCGKQIWD